MNKATQAFLQGRAVKYGNTISTGDVLLLFNNPIAKWQDGHLWISNGGYESENGATGSKTTKKYLNELPSVRLYQSKFKWYLNGVEWDGSWIQLDVVAPTIDQASRAKAFDLSKTYVKTDGWRGYEQPTYAVAGANDTGMWEDSPCRSDVAQSELQAIMAMLSKSGIKTKVVTCETSNVFCVHHYVVPTIGGYEKAKELVASHLMATNTRLAYKVN
jgi:hypothetical protein